MQPLNQETSPLDLSTYSDEEIEAAFELYPSLWAQTLRNEQGDWIEFDNHRFMKEIYNDFSPFSVVLKPPQVGMTTAQILKCLYVAKKLNKQIVYTLPTDDTMYEMVSGTFNRLIAQNTKLQEWVSDSDTMSHKSVGSSMIRFRGTSSAIQAMSYPAELNVHDELDASNFENIQLMETRQKAKADPWRWYFSHPSIAGFGVDIYWQKSDKREYVIKCWHCGRQQILTWPESINEDRVCYQCKYCKHELSDDNRKGAPGKGGDWLPTAQGEFRGYHISQLMCPWLNAEEIIKQKYDENKIESYFHNYVLGYPYVASENKISSAIVLKNVVNEINEQKDRIIIGVDTGIPWYILCMNKQGAFFYEKLKKVGDPGTSKDYSPEMRLAELLKRWPDSIVVGDQGGELSPLRKLQMQFPGRVYLAFLRKDKKSKELIDWGINEEQGTLHIDRNNYIQWMVEQLRDIGRIRFQGKVEEWTDFAAHFDNIYREIKIAINKPGADISTNYGAELIWKRNGADHYVFALLFALAGMEKFGAGNATFIKRDDQQRFPVATKPDNTISARRVLGKRIQGYVEGWD